MSISADEIIDEIIEREGGYVDHPNDRGGPTKYGITQQTWNRFREKHDPEDGGPIDVADIDERDAHMVYEADYVEPFEFINDSDLHGLVVDCAVNHGVTRATQWLQDAAGVKADCIVGPVTQAGVNATPDYVRRMLLRRRLKFYVAIATDDFDHLPSAEDSDLVFLPGWINRVCDFLI